MIDEWFLIIPDVHEDIETLFKILKKYSFAKKKGFLGDWGDSHVSDSQNPEEHLRVLADLVMDPDVTYILGNHDLPYLFPQIENLYCTGWRQETADAFNKIIKPKHRERMMRLHHWLDFENKTWLLSHAGIHPSKAEHPVKGFSREWVDHQCNRALEKLRLGQMSDMVCPGEVSGGPSGEIGGITWLRWRLFQPVEGLNQIVGHSYKEHVRTHIGINSENYCIDTWLKYVVLLSPWGQVIIDKVDD
jgi:hypothetical protein